MVTVNFFFTALQKLFKNLSFIQYINKIRLWCRDADLIMIKREQRRPNRFKRWWAMGLLMTTPPSCFRISSRDLRQFTTTIGSWSRSKLYNSFTRAPSTKEQRSQIEHFCPFLSQCTSLTEALSIYWWGTQRNRCHLVFIGSSASQFYSSESSSIWDYPDIGMTKVPWCITHKENLTYHGASFSIN